MGNSELEITAEVTAKVDPAKLEGTLKSILQRAEAIIADWAELRVTTNYTTVNSASNAKETRLVGETIIGIDGDLTATVPMAPDDTVREDLLELHRQNVTTAIEYRAKILNAVVSGLQGVLSQSNQ